MEVKIQIPDNCELIKDGDTYIVREKKQEPPRSWEEFCENYPLIGKEAFIDAHSNVRPPCECGTREVLSGKNWCDSKEEAEAFLALMQLRQLRKAWVGDWKQPDSNDTMAVIVYDKNKQRIKVDFGYCWRNSVLSFPTKGMAEDFLNCFRDLCKTAKILL